MQVPYSVEAIEGKGRGIVAKENIKKDTLIWDLTSSRHHIFSSVDNAKAVVNNYTEYIRVLQVGIGHSSIPNNILYLYDDSQYFNHSESPNCGSMGGKELRLFALRDIKKGDELTESYSKYSFPLWFLEELQKLDMMPSYCDLPPQNV